MPRVATSIRLLTVASASYTSNLFQRAGAFLSLFGKRTRASIIDSTFPPNSSSLTYRGGSCSFAPHIPSAVRPVLFSSRPSLQIVSMSSSAGEANLPYRYRWPRPAVTVDCLIYTLEEREPWILLIKRKNDPFKGSWALPGGFVDENEGLEVAARRELEEETGVTDSSLVQTGAYGDPGRDPRGHTITVAFMAWASSRASCRARAGDDAAEADFFPVKRLPKMAFDHLKIISDSWTKCHFRSEASVEGEGHGLAVVDRASGKTLIVFPASDIGAETLGSVQPTER